MIDVSVIIPSKDPDPGQLAAQLDALGGQVTDATYEVIVVDNGSVPPLAGTVPDQVGPAPVRVVDASLGPGINAARCAGIRAALADTMLFCDSDDVVTPTWIAAAHRELSTGDVAVGGPLRPFFSELGELGEPRPADALMMVDGRPFASGCNVGFTRAVLERTGGFDESWPVDGSAEDLDFSWRCAEAGVEVRFAPEMEVHYRLRRELSGVLRQRRFYGRGDVRFCDRHGRPPGRRAFARRVIGQCRGVLWYLPRSFGEPLGRWHLARRLGLVLGGIDGLLRPIRTTPVRGVGSDLQDPSVTVIVGPVDDPSAADRLAAQRPDVEVVVVRSDGCRERAVRDSAGEVLVVSREVPAPERIDQHVAALTTREVSAGRGLRWVRTRRLGRHPVLAADELGFRRTALVEIGGPGTWPERALLPYELGLRVAAAGLRVAELDAAADDRAARSPSAAFALGRRSRRLRRGHPELPVGSVTGLVLASASGPAGRLAGLLGVVIGRLVDRGDGAEERRDG